MTDADLPSVPESTLWPAAEQALPASSAPAPWTTQVRAILWAHRATPWHELERTDRRTIPLTVAAAVDYLDTPVGAYSEVFASPRLLRAVDLPTLSIPFIAVDSPASVHGGRTEWALPKTVARFVWSRAGAEPSGVRAESAPESPVPWWVDVDVVRRSPAFPLAGGLRLVQPWPDGRWRRATVSLRGSARLAQVRTGAGGPTLPRWLLAGTHPGLVVEGEMTISRPR
ncbi:MAG TPA: hypothetical protein VFS29_00755 [Motilibacteraceae bacterium]|nr:hypothetical protein [Motilibacteraceae bacterium]